MISKRLKKLAPQNRPSMPPEKKCIDAI